MPNLQQITYRAVFVCFNGMTIPLRDDMTRSEAKEYANTRKRRYRKLGFDVSYLGDGEWEYVDDQALMVGDDQGYLKIKRSK